MKDMNNTNHNVFYKNSIFVILILALILRLIGIDRSFSNDELSAISRLGYTDFSSLISLGVMPDGHPAFTQVFLWFWIKIFPVTEISIRIPFVICSILTMIYTYKIAKILSIKNIGILVISVMSFSAYFVDYSWLARPYSFGFLFSVLSFYFGIKAIKKYQLSTWGLYVLFTVLAMYTHYFSFLSVLVFGVFLLVFYIKEKQIKYLIFAGIICAILFIPHINITRFQLTTGGVGGWLGKPNNGFLLEYIFTIFNKNWLFISIVFLSVIFVFWKEKFWKNILIRKSNKEFLLLFSTFFLVFFIGFFYSKFVNAVLQYSVLIFCSPFLLFVLFYPMKFASQKSFKILFVIVFFGAFISLLFPKSYYEINRFGVFKDIAKHAKTDIKKYKAKAFLNGNSKFYFQFYMNEEDSNHWEFINFNENYNLKNFENEVSKIQENNLVYGWSNIGNPPTILSVIQTYFPYPVHHFYWHNSEYYLFSKDSILEEKDFYKNEKIQLDTNFTNNEYFGVLETSQNILKIKPFSYLVMNVTLDSIEDFDKENTLLVLEKNDKKTSQNLQYVAEKFELKNGKYSARLGVQIDKQKSNDIELKIYIWNKNKMQLKPISATLERWKENEILY